MRMGTLAPDELVLGKKAQEGLQSWRLFMFA